MFFNDILSSFICHFFYPKEMRPTSAWNIFWWNRLFLAGKIAKNWQTFLKVDYVQVWLIVQYSYSGQLLPALQAWEAFFVCFSSISQSVFRKESLWLLSLAPPSSKSTVDHWEDKAFSCYRCWVRIRENLPISIFFVFVYRSYRHSQ